jgi:hypothetical protein
VSKQEETLLLLADDLLGISTAPNSAHVIAVRRDASLAQSLKIITSKRIYLLLSTTPTVVHVVVVGILVVSCCDCGGSEILQYSFVVIVMPLVVIIARRLEAMQNVYNWSADIADVAIVLRMI